MKPPIIMPTMPAASTEANAGRGSPHSLHQRGNRRAEQLVVEAVEDDGQRGGGDEQLLIPAPVPFVEQRANVGRGGRHVDSG